MKSYVSILLLFVLSAVFASCKKMLQPNNDDHSTFDRVYHDPDYAEGLLMRAYTYLPSNSYKFDEVATGDAVTNDLSNSYLKMATGGWSALDNPENLWVNCNKAIMYINRFLSIVDTVSWKYTDKTLNALYIRRLKGESYALRGLFKYYLLRNHGGYGADGKLLGFPVYNKFLKTVSDFSKPRADFSDCVENTYADLDTALTLLPLDYGNLSSLSDMPAGFNDISDISQYNTVFGDLTRQRINGRIVDAIKARLALLVASPAFNPNNDPTLWAKAADDAAVLLDGVGGINGLDPKGDIFYLKDQVESTDLTSGDQMNIQEILWRTSITSSHTLEEDNFPPSLYGGGQVDPSQNFVNAFPMANGFPITDPKSGYDPDNPYKGRDPRLSLFVVYDGGTLRGHTINTAVGSGDDALNYLPNSTRTGYYLKKLLREDVNVNPISTNSQRHYVARIRYTELFLDYAEAANEAWGPEGTGAHAYSARDIIAAIRKRAGISQPDKYLMSINSKDDMRSLIHNARRLELCFEGFRFWDIRRWKADLTKAVKGVRIDNGKYSYFTVEQRKYNNDYMDYGPIPNNEIVRFHLIQNKGW